jgi:preprotein translocase subunit SecA
MNTQTSQTPIQNLTTQLIQEQEKLATLLIHVRQMNLKYDLEIQTQKQEIYKLEWELLRAQHDARQVRKQEIEKSKNIS